MSVSVRVPLQRAAGQPDSAFAVIVALVVALMLVGGHFERMTLRWIRRVGVERLARCLETDWVSVDLCHYPRSLDDDRRVHIAVAAYKCELPADTSIVEQKSDRRTASHLISQRAAQSCSVGGWGPRPRLSRNVKRGMLYSLVHAA